MKNLKIAVSLILLAVISMKASAQKGVLYPNFPESFEITNQVFKPGYSKKILDFPTGKWVLDGALIDSATADKPTSGKYAVRMNRNHTRSAYLQMNFDVKDGASKVTFWYSSYYAKADKPSTFRLEYSVNGGKTWKQTGKDIVADKKQKQEASFDLDVKGTVRFRIHKLGLGNGNEDPSISNGRLSIDDFAVYQN